VATPVNSAKVLNFRLATICSTFGPAGAAWLLDELAAGVCGVAAGAQPVKTHTSVSTPSTTDFIGESLRNIRATDLKPKLSS
jgi:hypothetical protein